MNNNNNEMNLVPSSDDDRDWILDAYYIGYYKKNWLNPKIEYELPPRVILKLHLNSSNSSNNINCKLEDLENLNIETTINLIKEWYNFQYFHNKLNLSNDLDLIKNDKNNNSNTYNGNSIHDISARNILKINKFNIVNESITSNNSSNSNNSNNSNNKKILNYCRIYSIETLKKSLIDNGIGLIILPYYTKNFKSNFWINNSKNDTKNNSKNNSKNDNNNNNNNQFLGFMSLIVFGYNDKGFIISNNNKYEYLFPYSDWGIQCEIWSLLHNNI